MRFLAVSLLALLAACSQKQEHEIDPVEQLATKAGYWKLAGADMFGDGGSYCLSFMSEDGAVFHLFALADNYRREGKLVFEIRRTYSDPQAIEVEENSSLQEAVIWLLQNYDKRPEIEIGPEYAQRMIAALHDRRGAFPFPSTGIESQSEQTASEGEPADSLRDK